MKNINITKKDMFAIIALVLFVFLMAVPIYKDKEGCEIAQAGYTCDSAENVMIDNCKYWAQWNCDSSADSSLPQIEWYIGNLCEIYKKNHDANFDCSLPVACNSISGENLC
jgi:hypothetical protein